ncbi:hypothetical protein MANES_10G083411v8 [Manihot esculenta]|uniref:Uncharacterized protein n=1 Tax=Manihot esculenta TaxID=3983 RepID=A0ACB7H0V8_MANES|nr:hypothetical protein MANES_10G083411v8 [Manihot esculenta]
MNGDLFYLQSSDNPSMILVSASLIRSRNFRSWNRAMLIALGVKQNLGFVDGTILMPNKDNEFNKEWRRCDYMIYELHRQISLISQENSLVSVYFIRLKRLWDKLGSIEILPPCSYGASKAIDDMNNSNRLIQFLMGLNENFDSVRDQVLVLDPFPSINSTYSMALKHESQKEILSKRNLNSTKTLVLFNQSQGQLQKGKQKKYDPKKGHYNHCNMNGHVRDTYFKLIGYPD